eukprot:c6935_g1_i1 orf=40-465(+)
MIVGRGACAIAANQRRLHFECQSDGRARRASWARQEPPLDRTQLQKLLEQHHHQPIIPSDPRTLVRLLQACGNLKALLEGHRLHHHVALLGFEKDLVIANYLITMYGNCESLLNARYVFDTMTEKNVVSWSAIISALTQNG